MNIAPLGLIAAALLAAPTAGSQDYRDRLPQDEIIYFVMPDRFENGDTRNDLGGFKGDRLKTGYDPTAKGYFHGGDHPSTFLQTQNHQASERHPIHLAHCLSSRLDRLIRQEMCKH